MAKIVLAGFDSETAKKLSQKLIALHHQTESLLSDPSLLPARQSDLIFLSGDDVRFQRGLAYLVNRAPSTPVIVASRTVEDRLWLSALEAGATDYCSTDENLANLAWIVDNATHGTKLHLSAFAGAA